MEDIHNLVYKVTKQVQESEEEFIITTITPLVENITEQKINKKELTNALLNYYNPSFPEFGVGLKCNRCHARLKYDPEKIKGINEIYCFACGRRMKLR